MCLSFSTRPDKGRKGPGIYYDQITYGLGNRLGASREQKHALQVNKGQPMGYTADNSVHPHYLECHLLKNLKSILFFFPLLIYK